jgi:hypothetical protein
VPESAIEPMGYVLLSLASKRIGRSAQSNPVEYHDLRRAKIQSLNGW